MVTNRRRKPGMGASVRASEALTDEPMPGFLQIRVEFVNGRCYARSLIDVAEGERKDYHSAAL